MWPFLLGHSKITLGCWPERAVPSVSSGRTTMRNQLLIANANPRGTGDMAGGNGDRGHLREPTEVVAPFVEEMDVWFGAGE